MPSVTLLKNDVEMDRLQTEKWHISIKNHTHIVEGFVGLVGPNPDHKGIYTLLAANPYGNDTSSVTVTGIPGALAWLRMYANTISATSVMLKTGSVNSYSDIN